MALDIRDIYIKWPDFPSFSENEVITDTNIGLIQSKLALILFTNQGDFIADPILGANLEYYLWETRVSADRIRQNIEEQIERYIPELSRIPYTVNTSIVQGELRDILLIDIVIGSREGVVEIKTILG